VAELPHIMEQFNHLKNQITDTEKNIIGNLTVTIANDNITLLTQPLMAFKDAHPNVLINLIASDDVLSLATGAAHVSLRAGEKPKDPDLIVRKMFDINFNYYASNNYIQRHGRLKSLNNADQHYWVLAGGEKQNIPMIKSIIRRVKNNRIVFQSNNFLEVYKAIEHGLGIGPIPTHLIDNYKNIHKVAEPESSINAALWFVYHRDLKENAKVKAFYDFITR